MGLNYYTKTWKSVTDEIIEILKSSGSGNIQMDERQFSPPGDREVAGYTFNLEFKNVTPTTDLRGSAVARDLRDVLMKSIPFRSAAIRKHVKIRMDQKFVLHINVLEDYRQIE